MSRDQQQDTAAMAIAWSERAKAALDLSRQYLAAADAVMDQDSPIADPWHSEMRMEVFKALTRAADVYESYADRCREAAEGCRVFRTTEQADRRAHYEEMARQAKAAPGVYTETQAERRQRYDTFGGRSYDVARCPHGCCASAVCAFVGDCASHGGVA